MDPSAGEGQPTVSVFNVTIAFSLLALDVAFSSYFNLEMTSDLLVAAGRCVVQLSLLGFVLDKVFSTQSPIAVVALGTAMLLLGANEVTFTRAKRRTHKLVSIRQDSPLSSL